MMDGNTRLKLLSTEDLQERGLYFKFEYPQNHKLCCRNPNAFTQLNTLAEKRLLREKALCDRV